MRSSRVGSAVISRVGVGGESRDFLNNKFREKQCPSSDFQCNSITVSYSTLHLPPQRFFLLAFFFFPVGVSGVSVVPAAGAALNGSVRTVGGAGVGAGRFCCCARSVRVKLSKRLRNNEERVLNLMHCIAPHQSTLRCEQKRAELTLISSVTFNTRKPRSCRHRTQYRVRCDDSSAQRQIVRLRID